MSKITLFGQIIHKLDRLIFNKPVVVKSVLLTYPKIYLGRDCFVIYYLCIFVVL